MKPLTLFTLVMLWICSLTQAQSPGVPVVVTLKKGGASETLLVGRTDTGLRLQPKGSTAGDYQVALADIVEVRFVFPATLTQAQEALNQSQWDRTASLLRPIVTPTLPYLDLPGNNGIPLVMVLADTLRRANKSEEALSYYEKLRALPKSPETIRAAILSAQCLAVLNRAEQAWKILQTIDPIKRDNELFALNQLARAQARLAQKDYPATLDEVSQAIAFSRMESETFPEALSIAAQCYESMSGTNVLETVIVQTTLPSTNRTSSTAATVSRVQKLPGNTNYTAAAQAIYRDIAVDFPNTIWAQKSQPKILPRQKTTGATNSE